MEGTSESLSDESAAKNGRDSGEVNGDQRKSGRAGSGPRGGRGSKPRGRHADSGSDSERPITIRAPKEKPIRAEDIQIRPREEVEISLRGLLEAGVHFGHQASRWNPKMAPYIYTSRNGIHIIDLPKTIQCWKRAYEAIFEVSSRGGSVLFVGTKKQAQDAVVEEAKRCGAFFVSRRWLGGMLTNFQTIRHSVDRMNKLETILKTEEEGPAAGNVTRYTKKEKLMMSRELEKLTFSLGGIRSMYRVPNLLFVIDIKREEIAVREAQRLDIPVVALVDTCCDPDLINYPIPSNDDGTRSIRLFAAAVADAVMAGRRTYTERMSAISGKPDFAEAPSEPVKSEAAAEDEAKKALQAAEEEAKKREKVEEIYSSQWSDEDD